MQIVVDPAPERHSSARSGGFPWHNVEKLRDGSGGRHCAARNDATAPGRAVTTGSGDSCHRRVNLGVRSADPGRGRDRVGSRRRTRGGGQCPHLTTTPVRRTIWPTCTTRSPPSKRRWRRYVGASRTHPSGSGPWRSGSSRPRASSPRRSARTRSSPTPCARRASTSRRCARRSRSSPSPPRPTARSSATTTTAPSTCSPAGARCAWRCIPSSATSSWPGVPRWCSTNRSTWCWRGPPSAPARSSPSRSSWPTDAEP